MARIRRRTFLFGLGLAGAGAAGHALWTGLRYPPLQYDPDPFPETGYSEAGWRVHAPGSASLRRHRVDGRMTFRAYVPEPVLRFEARRAGRVHLVLENLHREARFEGLPGEALRWQRPEEGGPGRREELYLDLDLSLGEVRELRVRFPERERYRFAALGDSGGGSELRWCLERAAALDADFFLHLGDVLYLEAHETELEEALRSSPLPVFATPGNHDFHGGHRYRFETWQEEVGPLNSFFRLAGVDFVGLDTAADTLPPSRGERGRLMRRVEAFRAEHGPAPVVVFTHRPLSDWRYRKGRRDSPHALNRTGEAEYLQDWILSLGSPAVLLCGHIHQTHFDGETPVPMWIAGEGTSDRGPGASILIGEFAPGEAPEFHLEALAMPASRIDPRMRERQGAGAYPGFDFGPGERP